MVIIIRGARPDADVLRRRDQIVAALHRMHAMGEEFQLRVANVFLAVSSLERRRKQHVMNATEVNAGIQNDGTGRRTLRVVLAGRSCA